MLTMRVGVRLVLAGVMAVSLLPTGGTLGPAILWFVETLDDWRRGTLLDTEVEQYPDYLTLPWLVEEFDGLPPVRPWSFEAHGGSWTWGDGVLVLHGGTAFPHLSGLGYFPATHAFRGGFTFQFTSMGTVEAGLGVGRSADSHVMAVWQDPAANSLRVELFDQSVSLPFDTDVHQVGLAWDEAEYSVTFDGETLLDMFSMDPLPADGRNLWMGARSDAPAGEFGELVVHDAHALAEAGHYHSEVFDASTLRVGSVANPAVALGITWSLLESPGTNVELSLRGSDDAMTWTDWIPIDEQGDSPSPPLVKRYFQFQWYLAADNSEGSPAVDEISLRFAPDLTPSE